MGSDGAESDGMGIFGDIWMGRWENEGVNWDWSIEDEYGWELGWNMEYGIWGWAMCPKIGSPQNL